MATIPRTYLVTSKGNLSNVEPKNGQVIALYDSDEVYYDVSASGSTGAADDIVRRKISGVKVITDATLPANPEEDVVYVYIGNHGTLPSGNALYDVRVWYDGAWYIVGTNNEDSNVKTAVSNDKFYLVGTSDITNDAIGSLLKNSKIYFEESGGDSIIYADRFAGVVDHADYANTAGAATSATSAEKDSKGRSLTQYIWSVTATAKSNGTDLTFSTGDPSAFPPTTVTAVDTRYGVFSTAGDGLVPMPVVSASSPLSDQILFGDGWKDKDNITIGTADKANADINGNAIDVSYIKTVAYDTATDILTVTYGDNHTDTVSIPNTEYPNYNGSGVAGLVPPASSSQLGYFLQGDGTWQQITIVTYSVFDASTDGLVPHPGTVQGQFLCDNHTWATPTDTKNTVGATSSNGQLLIVGAGSQATYSQSYTNTNAYIDNGILYSQGLQVVNVGQPASDFDVTAAYSVGDTCKNLGVYYRCTQAISATTASAYSETSSYAVGALCVYENVIYECNQAIDYSAATDYDDTSHYVVNDLCFYNNQTYICTAATPNPAGDFDEDCWDLISEFDDTKWDVYKQFDIQNWAIVPGQTLYNKIYDGYTLGSACAANVTDTVDMSTDLPTSTAVNTAINTAINGLTLDTESKFDKDNVVAEYDTASHYVVGDTCISEDVFYICIADTTNPAGPFDSTKWQAITLIDYIDANDTVTTDSSFTASASLASSTITSKRLGSHDYRITVDATNGSTAINAGTSIATSTVSFNKVYAVGLVDTTFAMFTLNGNSLTCDTQIPASGVIKVSINALA